MAYIKHPIHGNRHVTDAEVPALVAQGWTQWPRKKEDKALGDGSAASYWRAKFEAQAAALNAGVDDDADNPEDPDGEAPTAKRRGRPPKHG